MFFFVATAVAVAGCHFVDFNANVDPNLLTFRYYSNERKKRSKGNKCEMNSKMSKISIFDSDLFHGCTDNRQTTIYYYM